MGVFFPIGRKCSGLFRNSFSIFFHSEAVQNDVFSSLRHVTSDPFFFLLSSCRDLYAIRTTHAAFIVLGLLSSQNRLLPTKILSIYASFGEIHTSRKVFDGITDPDFYSFKVMIRWYFLSDLYAEIVRFYALIRLSVLELDDVVFSIVLKSCSELCDYLLGWKVHCQTVKFGTPDCFVVTGLVDFYSKCGDMDRARQVFDEMPEKTMASWTCMISGYIFNGFEKEGIEMFDLMRGDEGGLVEVNQFTLSTLINACSRLKALHQGRWVHGLVLKSGMEMNNVLISSIIDMYLKCSQITEAESLFAHFSPNDHISWTAMISGYSQSGLHSRALGLFLLMKTTRDPPPSSAALTSLISSISLSSDLCSALWAHAVTIKLSFHHLPPVANALTHMYSALGRIRDASRLFLSASQNDVVSWNSIIHGHLTNARPHDALLLFRHMLLLSPPAPDSVTLTTVVLSATSAASFSAGAALHMYSLKSGFAASSVFVGTSLVSLYSAVGRPNSARKVFDEMRCRTAATWNAMIYAHGMHGEGEASVSLFREMLAAGEVHGPVLTAVLTACSHGGMVGEGWRCFEEAVRIGGGTEKHLSGVVDMLARAGKLEEAAEVVERMPTEVGVTGAAALLHGCGLHSRWELGEKTAKRIMEMKPVEACYYVMLCKMYASVGKWREVKNVREIMKKNGLNKLPAHTFIPPSECDMLDFSLPLYC